MNNERDREYLYLMGVPFPFFNPQKRIVGAISFFNEAEGITQLLDSIYDFCDTIICIDGAYSSFPHKRPWSMDGTLKLIKAHPDPDQKILLVEVRQPWTNEMEKRTAFFQFGVPGDWYFIIDGDETLVSNDYGRKKIRRILDDIDDHILQIGVETVPDPNQVGGYACKLQRHVDGVVYIKNHFTFYSHFEGFWFGQYFRHQARRFYMKLQRNLPFKAIHHKRNLKRQKQKEKYYSELRKEEEYDWWNWIGNPNSSPDIQEWIEDARKT